jgi:hypothetical protein
LSSEEFGIDEGATSKGVKQMAGSINDGSDSQEAVAFKLFYLLRKADDEDRKKALDAFAELAFLRSCAKLRPLQADDMMSRVVADRRSHHHVDGGRREPISTAWSHPRAMSLTPTAYRQSRGHAGAVPTTSVIMPKIAWTDFNCSNSTPNPSSLARRFGRRARSPAGLQKRDEWNRTRRT